MFLCYGFFPELTFGSGPKNPRIRVNSFSTDNENQLNMWDIAMFANGSIGGSGYNFDISSFNESEINQMTGDPCELSYGHLLICVDLNFDDASARIDNGIIVTDKWILTSATTCLNFHQNPWNDYFIQAGQTNLTESEKGSAIKDYHIYARENLNQDRGCNQHHDFCLIELETQLVISVAVQAIGFQDFNYSTSATTTTLDYFLDKCWISAWSDGNLRTFKADVGSECYAYYTNSHISFRRNQLSTKKRANLRKNIGKHRKFFKDQKNQRDESNQGDFTEDIIDQIQNFMEIDADKKASRSNTRNHLCIDNLRNVFMC